MLKHSYLLSSKNYTCYKGIITLIIITTEKDDPKRDKLPTLARLFDVKCIDRNSFLKKEVS
jgi:hypothetical protein